MMRRYLPLLCIVLCLVSLALAQQRCPNNCNYPQGQCLSTGVCQCQSNWRGIDCSISLQTLPSLPATLSSGVAQGQWKYYSYYVAANTPHKVKLTMVVPPSSSNADGDLYVKKGGSGSDLPTRTSYDYAHTGTGSVSTLEIAGQRSGMTFVVGVYGYTAVAEFKLEISTTGSVCPDDCSGHGTCNPSTHICSCSTGWYGPSCSETVSSSPLNSLITERVERGQWRYYYVSIPQGSSSLNISVSQQGSGDVDLFIKKGSVPTRSHFDYADSSTRQSFHINVPSPQIGASYYFGFYGYATTTFQWSASVSTSTQGCPNDCSGPSHGTCLSQQRCECLAGFSGNSCAQMQRDLRTSPQPESISGLVKQSEWNFYSVSVPPSSSPSSSSPLTINLRHSAGQDCDLYVQRDRNPTRFDFLYRDITYSTDTQLIIQNPLDASWKIGVYGFSDCQYSINASLADSSSPNQCPSGCVANGGSCPPSNPSLCVCPPSKAGPTCQSPVLTIRSGQTLEGYVAPNQWVFYRYDGPASAFSIVLHEDSIDSQHSGVLWLYASVVQAPSLTNYDWSDTSTGVDTHRINVEVGEFIQSAHYYIGVFGSPYAINARNNFKISTWAAPFKK